jgi:hypothetical protein
VKAGRVGVAFLPRPAAPSLARCVPPRRRPSIAAVHESWEPLQGDSNAAARALPHSSHQLPLPPALDLQAAASEAGAGRSTPSGSRRRHRQRAQAPAAPAQQPPALLALAQLSSDAVAALGQALDAAADGSQPLLMSSAIHARWAAGRCGSSPRGVHRPAAADSLTAAYSRAQQQIPALCRCGADVQLPRLTQKPHPPTRTSLFVEVLDRLVLLDSIKDASLESMAQEAAAWLQGWRGRAQRTPEPLAERPDGEGAWEGAEGAEPRLDKERVAFAQVGGGKGVHVPRMRAPWERCASLRGAAELAASEAPSYRPLPPLPQPSPSPNPTPGVARAARRHHQRRARAHGGRARRPRRPRTPRAARARGRVGRAGGVCRGRRPGGRRAVVSQHGAGDEPGGARARARAAIASGLLPRQ